MSEHNYPRLLPLPPPSSSGGNTARNALSTHPLLPDLLARLSDLLRDGLYTTSTEFIALCEYNINPGFAAQLQDMSGAELQSASAAATLGIRRWLARRSANNNHSQPTTRRSGTARSSTAGKRTATRDGSHCIVSGASIPLEVAHLIPLACAGNNGGTELPAFLDLLQMFAGPEIMHNVNTYLGLESQVQPSQSKINRLENLMTLTRDIHRLWDTGKMTLEPVGDPLTIFDGMDTAFLTEYYVTLSFVPRHRTPSASSGWDHTTLVQEVPLSTLQLREHEDPDLQRLCIMRANEIPPPLPSSMSSPSAGSAQLPPTQLSSVQPTIEWQRLTTGTRIRLTTNDPVNYPLPHPDLLRLHAALSRVISCTAAAEPGTYVEDSDSEPELDEGLTVDLGWGVEDKDMLPSSRPIGHHSSTRCVDSEASLASSSGDKTLSHGPKEGAHVITDPARIPHTKSMVPQPILESPTSTQLSDSRVWDYIASLPSPPPSSPVNLEEPGNKRRYTLPAVPFTHRSRKKAKDSRG